MINSEIDALYSPEENIDQKINFFLDNNNEYYASGKTEYLNNSYKGNLHTIKKIEYNFLDGSILFQLTQHLDDYYRTTDNHRFPYMRVNDEGNFKLVYPPGKYQAVPFVESKYSSSFGVLNDICDPAIKDCSKYTTDEYLEFNMELTFSFSEINLYFVEYPYFRISRKNENDAWKFDYIDLEVDWIGDKRILSGIKE